MHWKVFSVLFKATFLRLQKKEVNENSNVEPMQESAENMNNEDAIGEYDPEEENKIYDAIFAEFKTRNNNFDPFSEN